MTNEQHIENLKKLKSFHNGSYGADIDRAIQALKQEPKTGHWIEKDGFDGDTYYDCSECGESWTTIEGTPWDNEFKYCPNCGAKMVETQESERV